MKIVGSEIGRSIDSENQSESSDKIFDNRIGRCTQNGLDPLLSIADASAYLGVSQRFIYDRLMRREIESQSVGRLRRIRLSVLETWLIRKKG